ncbi:aldehyde dehydrogenase family protein [Corynebacterium sp. 3HC-13]|uniref:bifunctional proline dehydrogenase/L-glutamate gamma-semialdehyde dehydrogenase n=1 Tax=Corynebacterium poyangense TaxID=2684405 RepID=UPI001CCE0232|nr:bifunctional proline dehydrogenase/L-glutamate gamma-semialdehyde dehydrogenase [Corynebacterium poyangense]MBZ8176580.1 aldehyde dehydrogenase family protein [Corynebacterium poyangense]
MTSLTPPKNSSDIESVIDAAVRRAHGWINATNSPTAQQSAKETKAAEQLAALLRDPEGVRFTMDFVDRVARPEDNDVAIKEMAKLKNAPDFLGRINKAMLGAGALAGRALPGVVMPIARKRLRQMVGHLVLDADSKALDARLLEAEKDHVQLNLNLLGEAVLGEDEARRRTQRTIELIKNPKVTYVSVKASSLCAQLNHWDIDGSTARLKERLRPVYREALKQSPNVFVNLDMEEYHDLHLTIRLFCELLSEKEFLSLRAGIVLQAYLPDTLEALEQLIEFAHERRAQGGAPIKVRLVKGANLSMEKVQAESHGWAQTPYLTKAEVDANYLRLLDVALQPEHADALSIGVASHNLFSMALAWELAKKRGVTQQLEAEMLQGMAPAQARAVHEVVGTMILYTPVVHAEDFDVAISYLVRRLEENSEKHNFLPSLFAPDVEGPDEQTPIHEQERRFRTAVTRRWEVAAGPRRTQNRLHEHGAQAPGGRFHNEPDTDPSLAANREWARHVLAHHPGPVETPSISDPESIDTYVDIGLQHQEKWGELSGTQRAEALGKIADALADARGELISAMAHEAGKTIGQSDPEVSEAIDFTHYYAQCAAQLDQARSTFNPYRLIAVVPPWNFPVAIPVGGMVSALAAGSAVLIKPAPQVVRCAEIAVAAIQRGLTAAGHSPELVQLVNADEGEAGRRLITHPQVDAVTFTGSSDTAKLFRSWRPDLRINAETSGKNALIVTPAADPDLAVADLYQSAFGHAGQKCSAASLVILVGSQGESERFMNQLLDAVRTIEVGYGTDISTNMNALIEPPGDKLRRGLTVLDPGEEWLITPKPLNSEETLWSPGVRDHVQPGSWYHTHECFGPILGIMRAKDLAEAVQWQNSTGYGLTGGIHSLDDDEIRYWMDHVEVGNGYINRGITGAIVQRQPFGGWKASSLGAGAKAGGPNYVAQLGQWSDAELPVSQPAASINPTIARIIREASPVLDVTDQEWLWQAADLDQLAWDQEFSRSHDPSALVSEANIFRYRPLPGPLTVRVGAGAQPKDLLRLKIAGEITGTGVDMSATAEVAGKFAELGLELRTCSDSAFAREVAEAESIRIRTVGEVSPGLWDAAVVSGSTVLNSPVLADGRRELLPFLLEQAISVTMHRFGVIRETGGISRMAY